MLALYETVDLCVLHSHWFMFDPVHCVIPEESGFVFETTIQPCVQTMRGGIGSSS